MGSQPLPLTPLLVAAQDVPSSPADLSTLRDPAPALLRSTGLRDALLGVSVCFAHVAFSLISFLLSSPEEFLEPPLIHPAEKQIHPGHGDIDMISVPHGDFHISSCSRAHGQLELPWESCFPVCRDGASRGKGEPRE